MANPYAEEIKWWKSRAAEFDTKRAQLRPLSYGYASQAYAARGNYNGAASLDSMRLAIYKKAETDRAQVYDSIKNARMVTPPGEAGPAVPNAVVKPSEKISELDSQVQRIQDKLGSIGITVGRNLVGGLQRAMDVLSRTTYAVQNVRMAEVEEARRPDSQGGTGVGVMEHLEIWTAPLKLMSAPIAAGNALLNFEDQKRTYSDAWQGLSGKEKTTGIDVLRQQYPGWAKEHNTLANIAGFGSDIISDPLTYITAGEGTIVKTGVAGGAKLLGKSDLAKALIDQTMWSKTGRSAGMDALEQAMKQAQVKPQAKAYAKSAKSADKAARNLKKGDKKYKAGELEDAAYEALKEKLGRSEAARIISFNEYNKRHTEVFDQSLRGIADAARFTLKHPFKATGSFGQGVRTGGVKAANEAAKTAHAAQKAKFVNDATSVGEDISPIAMHLRLFHDKFKGQDLVSGAQKLKVADNYEDFVNDVANNLFVFTDITQYSRRAARGRYSVLSQVKKNQYEFINLLSKHTGIDPRWFDDTKNIFTGPFKPGAKVAEAASTATKAAETVSEASPAAAAAAPEAAARAAAASVEPEVDEAVIDMVMSHLANNTNLQQSVFETLATSRQPESVLMDQMNGLGDIHVGMRELFKQTAQEVFARPEYKGGIPVGLDPDTKVINPNPRNRQMGDAAAEATAPNATMVQNAKIAEAIKETINLTIQRAAYQKIVNDPEVITQSVVNSAHDILNRVSADTHVQVMEYLHDAYGMSLPSMYLPLAHVETKVADGSLLINFSETEKPYVYQHLSTWLTDKIKGLFHYPVDAENTPGYIAQGLLENNTIDDALNFFDGDALVMNARADLQDLIGDNEAILDRLALAVRDLFNDAVYLKTLHYDQITPSVDTYTFLDHWMWRERPMTELSVGDRKIGRVASKAPALDFGPNQGSIPSMSPEVISNIEKYEDFFNKLHDGINAQSASKAQKDSWHRMVNEIDDSIKMSLMAPDLKAIGRPHGGVFDDLTPYAVDGVKAMRSLGTHVGLLNDTTPHKEFSLLWRRKLAAGIWEFPYAKTKSQDFLFGNSAHVMGELNEAISFGILFNSTVKRMAPAQTAEWIAKLADQFPEIGNLLRQADIEGTRSGSVGAGKVVDNAKTPEDVAKATERNAELRAGAADDPAEQARIAEGTSVEPDPTGGVTITRPSGAPGGRAAPELTPEQRQHVQGLMDYIYDNSDPVSLNKFMADIQGSLVSQIMMYDARIENALSDFQISQGFNIRFAGIPLVSVPSLRNNPIHTNAGVYAMNENLPKHLSAKVKLDTDAGLGSKFAQTKNRWLTRQTSRLDEGLRQIKGKVSSEANYQVKLAMDEIKNTYSQFKSRDELAAAVKGFFKSDDIDPRLEEVERRFNDISQYIKTYATYFTGKDNIGFDDNFVKGTIAGIMNAMPSRYRVKTDVMMSLNSDNIPFSREWFMDLSSHLARQSDKNKFHMLAGNRIEKLDLPAFEFALQHAYMKSRVRSETAQIMFETFGARMTPAVVAEYNKLEGIADSLEYQLVSLSRGVGTKYVPEGLKNYYVPQHLATEMSTMLSYLDEMMEYRWAEMNFGIMASLNNFWKSGVTVFSMKYHTGNVMSDGFINSMTGVRPASYKKAIATLVHDPEVSAFYSDPTVRQHMMDALEEAVDSPEDLKEMEDAVNFIMSKGAGKHISTVTIENRPYNVTGAEYLSRYRQYGLDNNNVTGNLNRSGANMADPLARTGYTIMDTVQGHSATREDSFRLSQFIHAFEQEARIPGRTADEIWLAARDRVVKYNFDYDNVTEFERIYLGRVVPFYKWTRNIVPLSFSWFFTNPKAYTIGTGLNRTMGQIFFPTQEDDDGNPIPYDTVVPRWISEQGAMPMEMYLDENGNEQLRYAVLNLPLDQALVKWLSPITGPFTDPQMSIEDKFATGIRNEGGSAGSMVHPLGQTAFALATGKVPISGGSLNEANWWEPMINMLVSGTGVLNETYQTIKGVNETGGPSLTKFLGDAGVLRVRTVEDKHKAGELRQQQDRLQAILKTEQTKWLKQNYPNLDPESDEAKKAIHNYYVQKGVVSK